MTLTVELEQEDDGCWIAEVMDIPGVLAYGQDREEAFIKAQVFASAIGLTAADAEGLRHALLDAARTDEAVPSTSDEYGERFVVDFMTEGPVGRARVRSTWMIRQARTSRV